MIGSAESGDGARARVGRFTIRGRYALNRIGDPFGGKECGGFRLTIEEESATALRMELEYVRGVPSAPVPSSVPTSQERETRDAGAVDAGAVDAEAAAPEETYETIAEWRDEDLVSFIALAKIAATAREAPKWCYDLLEVPGYEWVDGAPACVHFWTDRAWVVFEGQGPRRMRLRFYTAEPGGLLRPYHIVCDAEDLAAWGTALTAHLAPLRHRDPFEGPSAAAPAPPESKGAESAGTESGAGVSAGAE